MTLLRTTLPNGLLVLLNPIHTAPLISQWLWYRVGSRNETPGLTGLSHWTEHMQFKGTPAYPAGVLDKAISRCGGMWNAMTSFDWTVYYETLPTDHIDLALALEADRMTNSLFDPEEVESERTVIISERQGDENNPFFLLAEAVQKAAFPAGHPYHHEIIGEMTDLHTITRDDLYRHYRTHYTPNNAVLALAGDFDPDDMLARIESHFAPIPASPLSSSPLPLISSSLSPTRITIRAPGETVFFQSAYPAPPASHPDFVPLSVLDSLLSGASNPTSFGGALSNKTSRLYRALIEKDLAVSVSGGMQATLAPYLYGITALVHPDQTVDTVVQAMDDEIHRLQDAPPPQATLARAVKQARALFAYDSESITNQALWLGLTEMFATYEWFTTYLDRLESVTPADVQRVAQTYLREDQRVLGEFLPSET
ncbi:MAG: insulinase family protein [Anaerolineales bacterium]|nr:insulinase family protein [Anaerolineales bacterium]